MNRWCFSPDLLEGLAGLCGGGVLGIVSPALPDDPVSPSTSPSVNGGSQSGRSCSRSADAASASLRGRVSTLTPGTTIGT